jgi:hypothetical protein
VDCLNLSGSNYKVALSTFIAKRRKKMFAMFLDPVLSYPVLSCLVETFRPSSLNIEEQSRPPEPPLTR